MLCITTIRTQKLVVQLTVDHAHDGHQRQVLCIQVTFQALPAQKTAFVLITGFNVFPYKFGSRENQNEFSMEKLISDEFRIQKLICPDGPRSG